jgi:integrase
MKLKIMSGKGMAEGKAASTNEIHTRSILDRSGCKPVGKLAKSAPAAQPPNQPCPMCGSSRLYKDGVRHSADGDNVQRWLCRNCSYRFSWPSLDHSNQAQHGSRVCTKPLNRSSTYLPDRQLCVTLARSAKKLDTASEIKTVAGESQPQTRDFKGLVVQFMAYLEKEGYGRESKYPNNLKTLANLGADLLDPENVKAVIGKHDIKNGARLQYVYAYSAFCKMLKLSWNPPRYRQEETLPFIPDENELNALIYACRSRRMATFLQLLKETWVDPGEALGLRWIDISGNIVTINRPVKGHNPRQLQISNRLLAMLNELPKTSERIFPVSYQSLFSCYTKIRKKAAFLQKNPRLLSIELRSFRHWGGTMLAYYTNGNVLTVKRLLGHKRIENTMKYIGLIPSFKDEEFEIATATSDEEIKKIGAAGFVKYDERKIGDTAISYYRRPKRFSAV